MASGLSFFSSPPHPSSNLWQARPTITAYFTPQQHSKHSWSGAFAPTSPSPLRTSRNANLMSSPLSGGNILGSEKHGDGIENENAAMMVEKTVAITPISNQSMGQPSSSFSTGSFDFTTPFTSAPTPATSVSASPIFSFDTTTSQQPFATVQDRATQFQFAARARSSSPSALLQSHAKDNRDSRKRLFLERLRGKRDEARSERTGDQVLRMEFVKERRRWEDEIVRGVPDTALDLDWEGDVDVDVDTDGMGGQELGPTEEREIEELAENYYAQHEQEKGRLRDVDGMNGEFEEFSDDGYDEVFMEVLSQESTGQETRRGQGNSAMDGTGFVVGSEDRSLPHGGNADSEMDMS